MRGRFADQGGLLSYTAPDKRVPEMICGGQASDDVPSPAPDFQNILDFALS